MYQTLKVYRISELGQELLANNDNYNENPSNEFDIKNSEQDFYQRVLERETARTMNANGQVSTSVAYPF